ncbi:SpaH/EbpB family LPXTG-anchored major pilin [Microbacterium sp. 2C]|uniref:SpaH/EbpB family LPXTG-anchored major pilin n=1 Tax=Microbacterium paulum TaxID=2707006 RepID=UPI0018C27442|nr:SpaH/EbpB family LPXTG-anchored major pilin [Microbacterium paulum]MBG0718426.1 SpaH/EbpB family LPXTG-anchored major pilin [Microbacterium paulum]
MRAHTSPAPARSLLRGILAVVIALVLTLLSLCGGAQRSAAAESSPRIDPAMGTAIALHVRRQPDAVTTPASGAFQDTTGTVAVAGAGFIARKVPGLDLTTTDGQAAAAAMTVDDAESLTTTAPVAARATADANGDATLAPLGVGLYLVSEVSTPAGFSPSVPFLVALPLTDPDERDRWLSTVHVYPKIASAGVRLSVTDHDAVVLGDTVTWTSLSGIPPRTRIDGYRVVQQISPALALVGTASDASLSLECGTTQAMCPKLVAGRDFTWAYDPARRILTADFAAAGLNALAATIGAHPGAQVKISYRTTVGGTGELTNTVVLYGSRAAIDGGAGAPAPVSDAATTKWGSLQVVVRERGVPTHLLPGAEVRVYASAADAAAGRNPLTVSGVSQWTTDDQGRVVIAGLRLSDYADGLDRDASDPLYRQYFIVPVAFPAGYMGETDAIGVAIEQGDQPRIVTILAWRSALPIGLPVGLPHTGGQVPWAIAIGAVALVVVGLVLARRRRRPDDDESDE